MNADGNFAPREQIMMHAMAERTSRLICNIGLASELTPEDFAVTVKKDPEGGFLLTAKLAHEDPNERVSFQLGKFTEWVAESMRRSAVGAKISQDPADKNVTMTVKNYKQFQDIFAPLEKPYETVTSMSMSA